MPDTRLIARASELMRQRVSPALTDRAARLQELERIYVSNDEREAEFTMELEVIITGIMNSAKEGHAIAVLGPPGAGKSRLVNRRLDKTPELAPFDDGYGNEVEFSLRVATPSACTSSLLYTAILRASGYPMVNVPSNDDSLKGLVKNRLKAKMHKVIFLDEFQPVLKGPKAKGEAHLTNTMKLMMIDPEWPVWFVLAGVPDVLEFLARDTWWHMERRTRPIKFDDLENNAEGIANTREALNSLTEAAGFEIAFPTTDDFIRRLMHGGLWRFGMTIQLIKMSIEKALWDGEDNHEIHHRHFVAGYKRLASECTKATNVFLAENWHEIRRKFINDSKLSQAHRVA